MSRTLTADMLTAIADGIVRPHKLLEADFDGGMTYFTTAPYDIAWDGNTYLGKGEFLSVDRIEEREQLSAYGLRLSLSGIPSSLVTEAMGAQFQGRSLIVRQALFDAAHQVVADPMIAWSGFMDTMSVELTSEAATITLTATHRLHDMDRPRGGRYNDGDQQARFAGDKYFEFLEELQFTPLVWGYWLAKVDGTPRDSGTTGYVQTGGNGANDAGTRGYITPGASQIARDAGTRGYY